MLYKNADCAPMLFASKAYTCGSMAPPAIPITSKAEPIFVYLPKPLIASGNIVGHINELARPNKAINIMLKYPLVK